MAILNQNTESEELNPRLIDSPHTKIPIIDATPNRNKEDVPMGLRAPAVFRQFLIVFIANLSLLAPAMGLGYPAVTLQQLTDPTEPFTLTPAEASWFASINAIACPVGGLLSAYILDRLGRKKTIFLINITATVSWGLMGTSYYTDRSAIFVQVIIARFIIGIATGISSSPVSVYSAEICHPDLRGRLTLGSSIATATGIFAIYTLGYIIRGDWRLIAQIACGFSVFTFLLTFFIPESPTWLMVRNRFEESRKSLMFFRGLREKDQTYCEDFEQEFSKMQKSLALAEGEHTPHFWEAIRAPEVYKPLLIMIGFFGCQQFAGIFVVVVYAVQISIEAGVTIDPILCAVMVGFVRVPTTFAVGFILDRWGRRPPAMFSGLGMGLCMFLLAATTWFPVVGMIPHLPVICICMYIFTSTFGLMTLPFSMIGEVYPQRMRGTAAGITICCNYTMSFLNVKLYPNMVGSMGKENVFAFYGAASMLAIAYVYFFLPETKGKTLFEISENFKGSKTKKKKVLVNELELRETLVH